jgi:hypothetical protein
MGIFAHIYLTNWVDKSMRHAKVMVHLLGGLCPLSTAAHFFEALPGNWRRLERSSRVFI